MLEEAVGDYASQWDDYLSIPGYADCLHELAQCQLEGVGFWGSPDVEAARSKWRVLADPDICDLSGRRRESARCGSEEEAMAIGGHAGAQLALGRLYDTGEGGSVEDPQKALALYHASAAKGLPAAYYELGLVYASGIGLQADGNYSVLSPDHNRCMDLMNKAAEQGDYDAIVWISNEETLF